MTRSSGTGSSGGVRLWFGAGLFLLLSCAVFWGLATFFGEGMPRIDTRLVEPRSLTLIALFLAIYFLADGLRLHFVLRTLEAPVSFRQVMPLVFVNIFFSNITPMATGGGFAQVYYLQTAGVPVGLAAAATTIRTILAMLVIFIAAPLFLVGAPAVDLAGGSGALASSIAVVIALYLAGFLMLLLRPRWLTRVLDAVLALLVQANLLSPDRKVRCTEALRRESASFAEGFRRFRSGPRRHSAAAVLSTLLFLLTLFAMPALLMALLGQEPDWLTVIGTLSVVTFLMYFAPSPGGAGFSELAFAGLMAGWIDPSQLVLVIFVWRFLTIYLGMAIGAVVSVAVLRSRAARA
nr:lysylphosphatidylglycerol synthase transmembrane domain-containing protein [Oceanicola sp. 22II-s10i]